MPLTRSLPKACTGNMSRATADATEDAADMVRVTAMATVKVIATEKATTKEVAAADMGKVITKVDAAADTGKVMAKEDAAAIIKNSGHVASARIHIGRIARPL